MADTSNSVLFDAPGPKGRRTIRIVNWIAGICLCNRSCAHSHEASQSAGWREPAELGVVEAGA